MIHRFEEVKIKATRRCKDGAKWRQETQTFMQTISPFNKTAEGRLKTREEIIGELKSERNAWLAGAEKGRAAK